MRIILASASPRRRELLGQLGIEFEVCPARGEEEVTQDKPEEVVKELAVQKAKEIAQQMKTNERIRVIGADTIVVFQNTIFGKPVDDEDALRMLTLLQGNTHQVYTGVCVIDMIDGVCTEKIFAEKTDVVMYPATEEELRAYIATGEGRDKAGSYAIQGISGKFIKGIIGDYYNVVGLPMARLYQECFRTI